MTRLNAKRHGFRNAVPCFFLLENPFPYPPPTERQEEGFGKTPMICDALRYYKSLFSVTHLYDLSPFV